MGIGIFNGKIIINSGKILKECCSDCYVWASYHSGADAKYANPYLKPGTDEYTALGNVHSNDICYDGNNMWMVSGFNSSLSKIDLNDLQIQIITNYDFPKNRENQGSGQETTYDNIGSPIAFGNGFIWSIIKKVYTTSPEVTRFYICKTNIAADPFDNTSLTFYLLPAQGSPPTDICFDGTKIWVSNYYIKGVSIIDTVDGTGSTTNILTYDSDNNPVGIQGMAWNGTYMWGSTQGKVIVMNSLAGTQESFTNDCDHRGLAWDGTYMWSANYANSISKFDTMALPINTVVPIDIRPKNLVKSGNYLYIIGEESNKILKFDLLTNTFIGPPPNSVPSNTIAYYTGTNTDFTTGIASRRALP